MEIIVSPKISGRENMKIDIELFGRMEKGDISPTCRIYSWEKSCISLGYSQKIEDEIDIKLCERFDIDFVKRPTGGGIVFHTVNEVSCSFIFPFSKALYSSRILLLQTAETLVRFLDLLKIKAKIFEGGERWNSRFCFSYPSRYEITANSKKIIGIAQKTGRRAILQQCTISVDNNDFEKMIKVLKSPIDRKEIDICATNINALINRTPSFEEISSKIISALESTQKVLLVKGS